MREMLDGLKDLLFSRLFLYFASGWFCCAAQHDVAEMRWIWYVISFACFAAARLSEASA